MSDNESQLVAAYNRTIHVHNEDITAMLILDGDQKIVTAENKTSRIQLYTADSFKHLDTHELKDVGRSGIADMALMDSNTFAVMIPGFWFNGDIRIFKINEEDCMERSTVLIINTNSSGFCFQKGFFFVTFSPGFFGRNGHGNVEMISKDGICQKIFSLDKDNKLLFGNPLSRIHVDKTFRMFVSDLERNHLNVLKIDSINLEVTVVTRHKYHVTDIATTLDGTSFLATTHKDGIVVLHKNGSWVFNNFISRNALNGKPSSVAFNETDQQLFVATQRSHWYSPWNSWWVILVYNVKYTHSTDTNVTIEN